MNELVSILAVAGGFFLRVGLPIILLVVLGLLIDRWQNKREERIRKYYEPTKDKIIVGETAPQQAEIETDAQQDAA